MYFNNHHVAKKEAINNSDKVWFCDLIFTFRIKYNNVYNKDLITDFMSWILYFYQMVWLVMLSYKKVALKQFSVAAVS